MSSFYPEDRDLLIRIDERLKALDARVERLEAKVDRICARNNGWRDKGILVLLASAVVGLVEALKKVLGIG